MNNNRLEFLANLKRQHDAGAVSFDMALAEAWAEGEASVRRELGQRPASSTTGPTLTDIAGKLFEGWIHENLGDVLPKPQGRTGDATEAVDISGAPASGWMSDNPELVSVLTREFNAQGVHATPEEGEALRLWFSIERNLLALRGVQPPFDMVVCGVRLALALERLDVALIPGGKRDGA